MHMHFNSDTYKERVRAHGIRVLHQPRTRKDGSIMVVLESCVNIILKLGPSLLAVGALTSTEPQTSGRMALSSLTPSVRCTLPTGPS